MALQKQTVMLNLAQAGNQKIDPKSLTPGSPTVVENAQFVKGNRVDKRFGYDSLNLNTSVLSYWETYSFHSTDDLDTTQRIDVANVATVQVTMRFRFPLGQATLFKDELDEFFNIPRGQFGIFDDNNVHWVLTFLQPMTITIFDVGDYSSTAIFIRDGAADFVTVTKDGAASTPLLMNSQFADYNVSDSATFATNNPLGLEKSEAELSDLKGITGTEDHLLLNAGDNVYAYSDTKDTFRNTGKFIPCETEVISPDETSRPLQGCDSIHVGGVTYYTLLEMLQVTPSNSAYVWVMGVDEASGEVLFNPQQAVVNEQTTMKLFEFNGKPYIFYSVGGSTEDIYARTITPTGIGPEILIANDMAQGVGNVGGNFWDVLNWKDTRIVVGYFNDDFTNATIRYFDENLTELTGAYAVLNTPTNFWGNGFMLVPSSSDDRFFASGHGGSLGTFEYFIVNEDGTLNTVKQTVSATPSDLGTTGIEGGSAIPENLSGVDGVRIFLCPNMSVYTAGAADAHGTWNIHIANNTTETATTKSLYDIQIISKPWVYDNKTFFVFYRNAENDSSYFLGTIVDEKLSICSQILYGRAPDETSDFAVRITQRNITEISPGVARFAVLAKDSVTQMPGCVSAKVDFLSKELFTSVPYGNSVIVGGTNLHSFGGQYFRELNFFNTARAPILTDTAADGEITDGTHLVLIVYEFQDKNGYLHRSNPGPSSSITVSEGNAGSITVEVSNYTNSNIDIDGYYLVKIIPYRTLAGGSIFHRDDYFENWGGGGATPYIHNNGNFPTREIDLRRSDDELESQPLLFTGGGEVPPTPIPPVKYLSTWNGRLWAGGSARDETVFFSKLNQTNLMPEFSELFSISVQDKPGRTTGMIGFTDKMFLAKRGRLYYSFGSGPDNTGAGGSFNPFEEIPGVSGAINGKSIVVNHQGINYKSDKGVYTMGPGLNVAYTGAPFEDEVNEDIIKAITPIDSETIRFVTASGILSFNNFFNTWSKDSSTTLAPIDATLYKNQFHVLTSTKLLRENLEKWVDDETSYDVTLQTGWISFAGVAGFQRFYKMLMVMDNLTPYSVKVSIAYDYGDFEDETTFTDTTDARIIIYPSKQKCEAFRLKIEMTGTSGTEQSLNLNFIAVVAGVKKGLPKQLPVAQRIGVSTI